MRTEIEAHILRIMVLKRKAITPTEIWIHLGSIAPDFSNLVKGMKSMCARSMIEELDAPAAAFRKRLPGRPTFYTWKREGIEAALDYFKTTTTTNEQRPDWMERMELLVEERK